MTALASFFASLVFLLSVTTAEAATDYNYRWYSTSAIVDIRTTNYRSDISGAVYGWDTSTDLSLSEGSAPSGYGGIIVLQGNYGTHGWDAGVQPYNQNNQSCFDWPSLALNSNCNKTTKKVHYGYIYFNDAYGSYSMPKYGARHELGHFWGLGHVGCSTNSVMKDGSCRPNVPEYLQTDEINTVNSWY